MLVPTKTPEQRKQELEDWKNGKQGGVNTIHRPTPQKVGKQ